MIKNIRELLSIFVSAISLAIQNLLSTLLSQRIIGYLCAVDVIQRYDAVIEQIKACNKSTISVLDVGGGGGQIADFIDLKRYDLTVLDISMQDVRYTCNRGLQSICGDGTKLPFKDDSFDVVTSVASLEHIPKQLRNSYLNELKRVCKQKVVIYVPVDEIGEKYDKRLYQIKEWFGFEDNWTKEHIENGLPKTDELKKIFPNGDFNGIQNAKVWLTVMVMEALPIVNLILPGIIYIVFLKWFDKRPPFYGLIISWVK